MTPNNMKFETKDQYVKLHICNDNFKVNFIIFHYFMCLNLFNSRRFCLKVSHPRVTLAAGRSCCRKDLYRLTLNS